MFAQTVHVISLLLTAPRFCPALPRRLSTMDPVPEGREPRSRSRSQEHEVHEPRTMTCYKYTNHDHKNMTCFMWVDSSSRQVQFQSRGSVTPWHGSWSVDGEQVVVLFDAMHSEVRPAKLKSTTLYMCPVPGKLSGQDYRGRLVELDPITQWLFVPHEQRSPDPLNGPVSPLSGQWELYARWSIRSGDWEVISYPICPSPIGRVH